MSVLACDMRIYGCANNAQDNTGTQGGAEDTSVVLATFADLSASDNLRIVSSAAGDTAPTVTITGRKPDGSIGAETKTLNGTTTVACTTITSWERLLKAVKSGTTTGDVAVERVTATLANTAQGGAARAANLDAYITLNAGASGSDDTYNNMVIRITGGTGAGQIRQIIDYVGASKRAYVSRDWTTPPDGTSTFNIAEGMVFDKTPIETLTVVRLNYDAAADVPGGSARDYYQKGFIHNTHASLALTNAQVAEAADPSANVTFGLEASLGGTTSVTNRLTAPGGITFDGTTKNVANSGALSAGGAQAIWIKTSLGAGDAAAKTSWTPRVTGSST